MGLLDILVNWAWGNISIPRNELINIIDALDADGDGDITLGEVIKLIKMFGK